MWLFFAKPVGKYRPLKENGSAHGKRKHDENTEMESEKECVSRFGTKEHWDSAYEGELANFQDIGDVGEIWYGENSMQRILKWVCKNITDKNASIVDLGCGNGVVLVELAKNGYKCLTGVDYSEPAIRLAQTIAKADQLDICYKVADILNANDPILQTPKFNVCIDKGTYDAILLADDDRDKLRKLYREHVNQMLQSEGVLVIVSGNYTQTELTNYFKPEFEVIESIPAPTFSFGGQKGSTVTTLILRTLNKSQSQNTNT
ncbi:EEF1A lysine methyltransferase 2-like [Amphiura filiformis]|uniref:EEF1A lysine methyltransferase 2-like n=1 Tax=Amphiura filiformis TaxID=82378 RepID=UPI003B223F26